MSMIKSGLEQFISDPPDWIRGLRLGLLCNPASVDSTCRHARHLICERLPGQLAALFSPQHGFYAEKQDNMQESGHFRDPETGLPVFSLYGETRIPEDGMLELIDALIIDLQDVGTRVYTFCTTVSYCLEKAKENNKPVLILDRPNPAGGLRVEGNLLAGPFRSFVGRYPVPMRHGLTMGEYAFYINNCHEIGCSMSVVPMKGWRRWMHFQDTGLPWVPPSPNLPTPESALVYPGQVILEGTNISEGRGTTTPFHLFGAPYIETGRILDFMGGRHFPGGVLRPAAFEPMFNKWRNQVCRGFQLHITEPESYNAYQTSLKLVQAVMFSHPEDFRWRQPPYEYEWEKLPFDLITGDEKIRRRLERFESVETIKKEWSGDLEKFKQESRHFHLYE